MRLPPRHGRRSLLGATWRLAGELQFIAHRKFLPLTKARPGRLKPYLGGFSPTSPQTDPESCTATRRVTLSANIVARSASHICLVKRVLMMCRNRCRKLRNSGPADTVRCRLEPA
jgi:hypothetical protein